MKKIKLTSNKQILLMISVLILVISTVSFTLSLIDDANRQVTQDITDFSRGSYDILLRPANAQTEIERELNLIEENYLGIGSGGITIEGWEEVKAHPQVEIAAPVASIGLFTARERTWMIEKDPEEPFYYEVEYFSNDGVNTYSSNLNSYIYDFGNGQLFPSSPEVLNNYFGFEIASFAFPTSYHQVVAIDPEEEGKLTDYDFSPLEQAVIDYHAYKDGQLSSPIMSLADVSLPVRGSTGTVLVLPFCILVNV